MLATNNVIGLPVESIEVKISRFLNEYDSENTRVNYMNHIKKMFMWMYGKEISSLNEQDIQNLEIDRVKAYREFLRKEYNSLDNVNQAISVCKRMWDYFRECKITTGDNPFQIKKIRVKKRNHYGSLTAEELGWLYEYCLTLKKGMTRKLYFELLATVTCRKSIAQNLTWKDIKRKKNRNNGQEYWVVDTYDKTAEVDRAITDEFYKRLKDNYDSYSEKDKAKGLIFNVENQTFEKTLHSFCDQYDIDRIGRNIVQHSIKGSGLDIIQEVFGDINMTARAGGHKNIQTTYDKYIGKNEDYSKQPSVILGKDFDVEKLGELSKEDLLNVIQKCGKGTLIKIYLMAENMGVI